MSRSRSQPQRSHHLFILDRSGSMSDLWPEVIGSLNKTFRTTREIQKEKPDVEQLSYLIVFDDEVDVIFSGRPADYLRSLRGAEFPPRGMTALYDAIGRGISLMTECVEDGEDVLVTVLSDGFENSSLEYHAGAIAAKLKECRKRGWRFVFLGASVDVVQQATDIGISPGDSQAFDGGTGLRKSMDIMLDVRRAMARGEDRSRGFFEE